VKCARERHNLNGLTHNERIAAAAAWHTLNAAADRAERRRATAEGDASECRRCGREVFAPATLAAQADAVRGAIEGAVALGLTGPGEALADAYGGDTRRALLAALNRAADVALEHARAAACAAGTCKRRGTP
jgi:hypothetical protein